MDRTPRRYRFTITAEVPADHPSHGDPEWLADAAWGALANEYGLDATYSELQEVPRTSPL
ncbi:hypothetical protein B7486_69460 [cyanobacterium TDX16]|nr:hypothetical protein B7486_69460 [cyanobacterium TDX16]